MVFHDLILDGMVMKGSVLDVMVLDGMVLKGSVLDGMVLKGIVLDGMELDGMVLKQEYGIVYYGFTWYGNISFYSVCLSGCNLFRL